MPGTIDYTGKKYNKLTFTRWARAGGTNVGAIWWVICDCGNKREAIARYVTRGSLKSCGKCEEYKQLLVSKENERSLSRRKMTKELRRAEWEGGDWHLTPMQFKKVMAESCHFCGDPKAWGIVKVESEGGFRIGNVVAECRPCRSRRLQLTAMGFIDFCWKVVAHQVSLDPQKKVLDENQGT